MNELHRLLTSSGSIVGFFLQVLPFALLAGAVYALCRHVRRARTGEPAGFWDGLVRTLFVCYLAGLAGLLLAPNNFWIWLCQCILDGSGTVAVGPLFQGGFDFGLTLVRWLKGELTLGSWVKTMLIANVAMFLPLGFFLPFVSKKVNAKNIWAIAAAAPLLIECVQPVMGRSFDIDDLIMKFAGTVIGYFAAAAVRALARRAKFTKS